MPYTTLIYCEALAAHLHERDWVVFDCRHDLTRPDAGEAAYRDAHIPGAHFLHLDRDLAAPLTGRNGRHPLPDAALFAARLRARGVCANSQVVAYDDVDGRYAARLWWMLRWLGHGSVAVLDGGWKQWLAGGGASSSQIPVGVEGNFAPRQEAGSVDVQYIQAHLRSQSMQIIDARAEDRYRGENETLDPVAGHIPGAINRPFLHNLNADGRFKPAALLKQEFQAVLGDVPTTRVVHQCGSGVTACHNLLAMEIAGLTGSRLYPGSWSEWCAEPTRPIATGPAP